MSWREAVRRHFPELAPDDVRRASVPSVPTKAKGPRRDTVGTLARLEGSEQHDAHVAVWMDWQERAAIMEFDGELQRSDAEVAASNIVRLKEFRS